MSDSYVSATLAWLGAPVTVNVIVNNKERPVNLDISTIHLPLAALASITHRLTGLALFIGMGFLIWGLDASLESQESFNELLECLDSFFPKMILWAILAGLIYHFVAGIKHLLMDTILEESLENSELSAKVVVATSVVLILIAGVWIW